MKKSQEGEGESLNPNPCTNKWKSQPPRKLSQEK
jgi:hypothetical protein